MRRLTVAELVLGFVLSVGEAVGAQPMAGPPIPGPFFISLGDGYPTDVSADGTVVVGERAGIGAFRWTLEGGFEPIDMSRAWGVSADGSVVVGDTRSGDATEATRWKMETGGVGLGDFPGGGVGSSAFDVSAAGTVVVGSGTKETSRNGVFSRAFRWAYPFMVDLGELDSANPGSVALGVSADGSVVIGKSGRYFPRAFRWTKARGMVRIGGRESRAHAVSADGTVIVGGEKVGASYEAIAWAPEGVRTLGELPTGGRGTEATDVSADGSVIIGFGRTFRGTEVFYWDAAGGIRKLAEVLEIEFGFDLGGWILTSPNGISDNGRVIVGRGYDREGIWQGWLAILPDRLDVDADSVPNDDDNCPGDPNVEQSDAERDGVGDACDNCVESFNPDQRDTDADSIGDVCDAFPDDPDNELAQCAEDLGETLDELEACLARPLIPDEDFDGEADPTDACPGTSPSEEVDQAGCSLAQFCDSVSVENGPGTARCARSDWKNDEPVEAPLDCVLGGFAGFDRGVPDREASCIPRESSPRAY